MHPIDVKKYMYRQKLLVIDYMIKINKDKRLDNKIDKIESESIKECL